VSEQFLGIAAFELVQMCGKRALFVKERRLLVENYPQLRAGLVPSLGKSRARGAQHHRLAGFSLPRRRAMMHQVL